MIQRKRKATFKIGDTILGVCDATDESINSIIDIKCTLAIENKTLPENIDVDFEDQYVEYGHLSIDSDGKLIQPSGLFNFEVNSLSWVDWIDESTEHGVNTILNYIKNKNIENIIKFK